MALQRSALWAVALSALALALPVTAQADHGQTLLDDDLATYFAMAQSHWGGPAPSCLADGVRLIPVHAVLYDDPVPTVAARADQPGCRLSLDRGHWRRMRSVEACTIVTHEWGHLLGHGHVEDPLDLMADTPTRAPAGCAALERRSFRATAAARRGASCRAPAKRARPARRVHGSRRGRPTRLACVRRLTR